MRHLKMKLDETRTQALFASYASAEQVASLQKAMAVAFVELDEQLLNNPQDKAMLLLMKKNCPIPLGMPAYLVKSLINDKESYYTADILMGQDPAHECPFIDDYLDLTGYQFIWGALTQQKKCYDEDGLELHYAVFGFSFEYVLRTVPRTDIWESVAEKYDFGDMKYEPDDSYMEMNVLEFHSYMFDQTEQARLRMWLAKEFIPQQIPLLLRYLRLWLIIQQQFPEIFEQMLTKIEVYPAEPIGAAEVAAMNERKALNAALH